jgi:hypothetical protein
MDYMFNLPSNKHGNDYVFVVIDRFSKMEVLAPYKKSITTKAIAKLFFQHVSVHFGIPQTIVSDRDSRFLRNFWSSLWLMMDTKMTKSIAFHPQTDGKIEVVNKMIVHILNMYNYKHPFTWDESLLVFNIATIDPYATLLATTLFRCAWDSNHWPLM